MGKGDNRSFFSRARVWSPESWRQGTPWERSTKSSQSAQSQISVRTLKSAESSFSNRSSQSNLSLLSVGSMVSPRCWPDSSRLAEDKIRQQVTAEVLAVKGNYLQRTGKCRCSNVCLDSGAGEICKEVFSYCDEGLCSAVKLPVEGEYCTDDQCCEPSNSTVKINQLTDSEGNSWGEKLSNQQVQGDDYTERSFESAFDKEGADEAIIQSEGMCVESLEIEQHRVKCALQGKGESEEYHGQISGQSYRERREVVGKHQLGGQAYGKHCPVKDGMINGVDACSRMVCRNTLCGYGSHECEGHCYCVTPLLGLGPETRHYCQGLAAASTKSKLVEHGAYVQNECFFPTTNLDSTLLYEQSKQKHNLAFSSVPVKSQCMHSKQKHKVALHSRQSAPRRLRSVPVSLSQSFAHVDNHSIPPRPPPPPPPPEGTFNKAYRSRPVISEGAGDALMRDDCGFGHGRRFLENEGIVSRMNMAQEAKGITRCSEGVRDGTGWSLGQNEKNREDSWVQSDDSSKNITCDDGLQNLKCIDEINSSVPNRDCTVIGIDEEGRRRSSCTRRLKNNSAVRDTSGAGVSFYKTKLCQFYIRNTCRRGSSCNFAHSNDEIRESPDLLKTRLCRGYRRGSCPHEFCAFAHGMVELRHASDLCRTNNCSFTDSGRMMVGKDAEDREDQTGVTECVNERDSSVEGGNVYIEYYGGLECELKDGKGSRKTSLYRANRDCDELNNDDNVFSHMQERGGENITGEFSEQLNLSSEPDRAGDAAGTSEVFRENPGTSAINYPSDTNEECAFNSGGNFINEDIGECCSTNAGVGCDEDPCWCTGSTIFCRADGENSNSVRIAISATKFCVPNCASDNLDGVGDGTFERPVSLVPLHGDSERSSGSRSAVDWTDGNGANAVSIGTFVDGDLEKQSDFVEDDSSLSVRDSGGSLFHERGDEELPEGCRGRRDERFEANTSTNPYKCTEYHSDFISPKDEACVNMNSVTCSTSGDCRPTSETNESVHISGYESGPLLYPFRSGTSIPCRKSWTSAAVPPPPAAGPNQVKVRRYVRNFNSGRIRRRQGKYWSNLGQPHGDCNIGTVPNWRGKTKVIARRSEEIEVNEGEGLAVNASDDPLIYFRNNSWPCALNPQMVQPFFSGERWYDNSNICSTSPYFLPGGSAPCASAYWVCPAAVSGPISSISYDAMSAGRWEEWQSDRFCSRDFGFPAHSYQPSSAYKGAFNISSYEPYGSGYISPIMLGFGSHRNTYTVAHLEQNGRNQNCVPVVFPNEAKAGGSGTRHNLAYDVRKTSSSRPMLSPNDDFVCYRQPRGNCKEGDLEGFGNGDIDLIDNSERKETEEFGEYEYKDETEEVYSVYEESRSGGVIEEGNGNDSRVVLAKSVVHNEGVCIASNEHQGLLYETDMIRPPNGIDAIAGVMGNIPTSTLMPYVPHPMFCFGFGVPWNIQGFSWQAYSPQKQEVPVGGGDLSWFRVADSLHHGGCFGV